jgi:hypothetical protein
MMRCDAMRGQEPRTYRYSSDAHYRWRRADDRQDNRDAMATRRHNPHARTPNHGSRCAVTVLLEEVADAFRRA